MKTFRRRKSLNPKPVRHVASNSNTKYLITTETTSARRREALTLSIQEVNIQQKRYISAH